jgi:hypothetical protein
MAHATRVVLPFAAPAAYLAWMAFASEVAGALRDRPNLTDLIVTMAPATEATLAAAEGIALQIRKQAEAAEREGQGVVAPVIESDPDTLDRILIHFERRAAWLDHHLARPAVAAALGVDPLDSDLAQLRDRSFLAIRTAVERGVPLEATESA